MNKIEAIVRPGEAGRREGRALGAGFVGLNIVDVTGRGVQKGIVHAGRGGEEYRVDMLPKASSSWWSRTPKPNMSIDIISKSARTGNIGDGKIFIIPVAARSGTDR